MKLIMTKGLPGSGKTYWAKSTLEAEPNTVLICKDDLRAMMHDSKWSPHREKFILKVRDQIIVDALKLGQNVIVHDTNLHRKHEERLRQLARENKAEFEVKDFTWVPLEHCIEQDLLRFHSVGSKVIIDMWKQFLRPVPPVVKRNEDLPNCIICDIDGTLALFGDANPYERDFTRDELNEPIARILDGWEGKTNIILVSGRKDTFKDQTMIWLLKKSVPYTKLFMRAGDDSRKDVVVKQEIYETYIKDQYNVLFVLDDRDQVVDFWRSIGLTCLQVAEGDF